VLHGVQLVHCAHFAHGVHCAQFVTHCSQRKGCAQNVTGPP
jgi:hypothetical protein